MVRYIRLYIYIPIRLAWVMSVPYIHILAWAMSAPYIHTYTCLGDVGADEAVRRGREGRHVSGCQVVVHTSEPAWGARVGRDPIGWNPNLADILV